MFVYKALGARRSKTHLTLPEPKATLQVLGPPVSELRRAAAVEVARQHLGDDHVRRQVGDRAVLGQHLLDDLAHGQTTLTAADVVDADRRGGGLLGQADDEVVRREPGDAVEEVDAAIPVLEQNHWPVEVVLAQVPTGLVVGEQVVLELSEAFVALVVPAAVIPGHRLVHERELGDERQAELVVRGILQAQPLDDVRGEEVRVHLHHEGGHHALEGGQREPELDDGDAEALDLGLGRAAEGRPEDGARDGDRDLDHDLVDDIEVDRLNLHVQGVDDVVAGENGTVLEDDLEGVRHVHRGDTPGTNGPL